MARSFLAFPVGAIDLVVLTNTTLPHEMQRIVTMLEPLAAPATAGGTLRTFRLETHPGLADPWLLLWSHKPLIRDQFLACEDYTHFIYAEDDILVSWGNFRYFNAHRVLLEQHGLIPGFQRIEYNQTDGNIYLLDQSAPEDLDALRKIDAGEHWFVTPHFPHCAMFVLDRPLAQEYVASAAFELATSRQVARHFGVAERAAMGLCFENIPDGFHSRWAVPVHKQLRATSPDCWLFHIANNYTGNPQSEFGKILPRAMFAIGSHTVKLELKPLPASLPAGGYVDHYRIGAQAFIRGWGLMQAQLGQASICIDTNLPVVEAEMATSPRGDVVAAIGDRRLIDCGFQIRLVLDRGAAWPDPVRLALWTDDPVYGRHRLRTEHLPPLVPAAALPKREA